MRRCYLLLPFAALFLFVSCSKSTNSAIPTSNDQSTIGKETTSGRGGFKLIDERTEDLDDDKKLDSIKLSIDKDDPRNVKVKLSVNTEEKIYEVKTPFPYDSAKKLEIMNIGKGLKGIEIKLFSTDNENSFVPQNASPYLYDYNCIIVGFSNHKINTLLNLLEYPFNKKDNYSIKYINDFKIKFIDNSTDFNITYKAYVSEVNQTEYEKGFKILDSFKIPEGMENLSFYNIEVKDEDSDGIDEIICSKFIPGVYNKDVLGVIDYTFKADTDKYCLVKETLNYNKLLGLSVIKEELVKLKK